MLSNIIENLLLIMMFIMLFNLCNNKRQLKCNFNTGGATLIMGATLENLEEKVKTNEQKVKEHTTELEVVVEIVNTLADTVDKGFKRYDDTIDYHTEEIENNRRNIVKTESCAKDTALKVGFVEKVTERLEKSMDRMTENFEIYTARLDRRAEKTDEHLVDISKQSLAVIQEISKNKVAIHDSDTNRKISDNNKKGKIWEVFGKIVTGIIALAGIIYGAVKGIDAIK